MPRQQPADTVREVVAPVVDRAGLYLEDVVVSRAGSRSVVRVTLDLPEDVLGSLDLDAVADVSREVSEALDAASDVLPGQYTLEVSTPGTSRPLTEARHFKRARGRRVSLALRDGRTYEGRLSDVEGDELVLTEVPAGQPERVDRSDVARGSIEVELSRSAGTTDDEEA
ncbi:ribosome maturation factor [Luteimicrobium xylanilyticum]|uniref:Ribosome maturation factor RimP n=1 Tax=Luteimicrobium xylanilyticum TaxID=1133546 RepID=A0A5P9Q921_9MICO|nr:ribosome maturation factor RimP [Luteimicrobium xylanilyticum]QFU97917.1 Ribosome maturation factor RimP [Luteimicrobium xylanilyticum]